MIVIWRWFRFVVAIVSAGFVGVLVVVLWLLAGQRYQYMLTQRLSALLGAEVRVGQSRLSWQHGLGIQLNSVTVHIDTEADPSFTAERIDVLLDFSALLRAQLLFRRIDCTRPRIRLFPGTDASPSLPARVLAALQTETDRSYGAWFSPTLVLQEVRLDDGEIRYARTPASDAVVLTRTDASLVHAGGKGITVGFSAALGQKGEMGHIALRGVTPKWEGHEALQQLEWQGAIRLRGVRVQQLGRMLGAEWLQMALDLSGRYQGKWTGPIELTGKVKITGARIGKVEVSEGRVKLTKVEWPGQAGPIFDWQSFARSLAVEAQLEEVRGEIGEGKLPVTLHTGILSLRRETLTVTGIAGTYGTKSQITDITGTLRHFFDAKGPALDLRLGADVDLEEGVGALVSFPFGTERPGFSPFVTALQGRALVRLGLQMSGLRGGLGYDGEVVVQQAEFQVPVWNVTATAVSGSLRLNREALTTDALTLRVGQSWLTVRGSVHNYLTSQRSADLRLAFTEACDHDLVPLMPDGFLLPRGGSVSGQVEVVLSAQGQGVHTRGRVTLSRIRLYPLSFLHPIEVMDGEVAWRGQEGTFVVRRGQLPGGNFVGDGSIHSLTPLNLEVSLDFADLDLESALVLDTAPQDNAAPQDPSIIVRADLFSGKLSYKDMEADNVRLHCHWHDRQADVQVAQARVAGGTIRGEVVLWPDIGTMFIAPQVTSVDVSRFLRAVGTPTDVLTGLLNGKGKIYVPDWRAWTSPARWEAVLSLAVTNGVAKRLPILVRLWSALSLQGLLSLQLPSLPNEGLAFSSLRGDFAIGQGLAVTDNLSLTSSAVRLDARGEIDLVQRSVDLKTALVPLHGITSSVAKVPFAGELLARGADRLTTLSFHVRGPFDDPRVTPVLVDTGG